MVPGGMAIAHCLAPRRPATRCRIKIGHVERTCSAEDASRTRSSTKWSHATARSLTRGWHDCCGRGPTGAVLWACCSLSWSFLTVKISILSDEQRPAPWTLHSRTLLGVSDNRIHVQNVFKLTLTSLNDRISHSRIGGRSR